MPAVYLELPMIDHAFDLPLLRVSPPAQAALYDVERFLAIMSGARLFGPLADPTTPRLNSQP